MSVFANVVGSLWCIVAALGLAQYVHGEDSDVKRWSWTVVHLLAAAGIIVAVWT